LELFAETVAQRAGTLPEEERSRRRSSAVREGLLRAEDCSRRRTSAGGGAATTVRPQSCHSRAGGGQGPSPAQAVGSTLAGCFGLEVLCCTHSVATTESGSLDAVLPESSASRLVGGGVVFAGQWARVLYFTPAERSSPGGSARG
jgi:hypothetical protein